MYELTKLIDVAPLDERPKCLACNKSLLPHVRTLYVKIQGPTAPATLLQQAEQQLRAQLKPRVIDRVVFTAYDARALSRVLEGIAYFASIRVCLWVVGDYDGREYIDTRPWPCFCKATCAVEFGRLAAASGFVLELSK